MKRHRALEPFSRDHNIGLILARSLQLGREGAEQAARAAWEGELKDHFDEEERLLGPLLDTALLERLITEHRQIAQQLDDLPGSMAELGSALHEHIRWEERVLFPWLETHATEEQLADLEREANVLEVRRWETDARRKTLVTRRWS
ncbi:MAG: hypothetical protein K1X67_00455 [Fimbriimonadaceae bacterium]|nr:hypothetical protein [Fimbriimonadaceae bacterium]